MKAPPKIMIYHLVWFKLNEEISRDEIAELEANLKEMTPQIPQIIELEAGEDFSGRSRGFSFGLSVKFASREDSQIYDKHEAHQAFIAKSRKFWTDVMALDFEV
ncbi:Stress responsive A/B Barrel Domain [Abditibacterium utsteinense]|uniref:Stress responsive A/B Barrel Domain n=1 Tax=Abditibacterium utsteinense TaxID=1960156 RepID=A0A2S8SQA6_9BACT|nr:Dabb family protein [Abditibacterium utsteinense]PQV62983.1 Stress responsive A/B Barrel Domain [Abditibacterium utsteinense]